MENIMINIHLIVFSFFVNSDLDEPDDDDSLIKRKYIFNWAKELAYINTKVVSDKNLKFRRIMKNM